MWSADKPEVQMIDIVRSATAHADRFSFSEDEREKVREMAKRTQSLFRQLQGASN
jgi:hypothetical protein